MRHVIVLAAVASIAFALRGMPGEAPTTLVAQSRPASTLPEGDGRADVERYCTSCHELAQVTRAGYSEEGWRNDVHMMINVGAPLPKERIEPVVKYLAANFPERPRPKAVIVPGSARISIEEWTVPTPGSRPHDPLSTADGAIWYTGQFANVLGRRDPKTGQIKEYPLRTPNSGPHGLTADATGGIWYTANFQALVGRLDPATGEIREFPMPESAARDPHTPLVDHAGRLWFTVQGGNMVGRLDPASGKVTLAVSPTPKSRPYGMVISSKGVPFFVEFGANKVASIDPESLRITEYPLPSPDARPRRVAITRDDAIWYSDYTRGYLGRLDPATGALKEWPSPGGPKSAPYGIASIDDVIWYSESGVEPNTIVRFDPRTEKFQTWAIPSGGGVVRNVSVTPDKNLAIACSGVNRIGLVKIAR